MDGKKIQEGTYRSTKGGITKGRLANMKTR